MATFKFGKASQEQLDGCHSDLVLVAKRALGYGVLDFSVIEGHRSSERQMMLYRQGTTHIDGKTLKGNHMYKPSRAMDLLPYPATVNGINVWKDKQRFCVLAGLMYAAAWEESVLIRWGGDWDGDGNNADSNLHDMPHFELVFTEDL